MSAYHSDGSTCPTPGDCQQLHVVRAKPAPVQRPETFDEFLAAAELRAGKMADKGKIEIVRRLYDQGTTVERAAQIIEDVRNLEEDELPVTAYLALGGEEVRKIPKLDPEEVPDEETEEV